MDDVTINSIQMLTSYGALGVCCIYFMVKDWIKSKEQDEVIEKNTEAISKFNVALEVLISQGK